MALVIDASFEFLRDTPLGKDPDSHCSTLREYHRILWSKPLPSGEAFTLTCGPHRYLEHRSSSGSFFLASDAITTRLRGRASRIIGEIPDDELPEDLRYTIGSSIVFPSNRVDGAATINGARGFHPRIADRFDLTLECIRRHYTGERSPLSAVLARYSDFFALFGTFAGYTQFFLLQDLLSPEDGSINFFHQSDNFSTSAVPNTAGDYLSYVAASNNFIRARNSRIDAHIT